MRVQRVLLPVLVHDPSVFRRRGLSLVSIHPVVVSDPQGFGDGPVCRRVAVVDVDPSRNRLRPPARVRSKGGIYRDTGTYRVTLPVADSPRSAPWMRGQRTMSMTALGEAEYNDPFLKVSAFGSVVRTLAFIEDPAVLGRPVRWAFRGRQLLVVPRAGKLDNAFYHRDSHSLYLFSFTSATRFAGTVHCALSQDIVVHEATGEASLADFVRAMLAADAYYWPRLPRQRRWLLEECQRRHILDRAESRAPRGLGRLVLSDREFGALIQSRAMQRRFVEAHRRLLAVPDAAKFMVRAHVAARRIANLSTHRSSESASLGVPTRTPALDDDTLLILKVAYWDTEPNDLGPGFRRRRMLKLGTTLALDRTGNIHALLTGGRDPSQRARRDGFLHRLAAAGALLPPGHAVAPDGEPLQCAVLSRLRSGALQLSGSFRALHLVDAEA